MGQQQLLLLVLGIVIVGLAVVVGIQAFDEGRFKAEVDSHTAIGLAMASDVVAHYQKPNTMGGLDQEGAGLATLTVADLGYDQNVRDTWSGFSRTGTLKGGVVRHLAQNGAAPFLHIHRLPLEDDHARVEVHIFGPGQDCLVTRHNRMPSEVWSDGAATGTPPANPDATACSW